MKLRIHFYITMLLLLKVLVVAQPVLSQSDSEDSEEQLLFILPEGWKEEFADRTESLSTTEYVPEGQSEANWEEMLTIQTLLNKPSADPVKMMSGITKYLSQDCSEFDYKPIDIGGIDNNYPSMAVLVLCGQEKERNGGYVSLLRGISGEENYFLLQKNVENKTIQFSKKIPHQSRTEKVLAWIFILFKGL